MFLLGKWFKKTVLGAIAIALCLSMVGCGKEPETGSEEFTFSSSVYPCGPPTAELHVPTGVFPFSDLFLEWTPDGSQLMFSLDTTIMVVNTAGTQLRMLVDALPRDSFRYGFHADVSPDGTQVVFSACQFPWELQFLSAKRANALLSLPVYSPDGYDVALISIDGGAPQRLTENQFLDHFPAWSPDGTRIAFIASIARGNNSLTGKALFTMAADGSDIQELGTTHFRAVAAAPLVWSPDGARLAFLMNEGGYRQGGSLKKNLYTVRPNGRELIRIAENVGSVASWSPDGQRLAVAKYVGDDVALFTLAADGSDQQSVAAITNRDAFDQRHGRYQFLIRTVSWSPDGPQILYSCDFGVCVVNLESGGVLGLLKELPAWDTEPYIAAWSPDGSRIAIYTPGIPNYPELALPTRLYTVNGDGTDRRDLIRVDDDGNLVPANPPEDES